MCFIGLMIINQEIEQTYAPTKSDDDDRDADNDEVDEINTDFQLRLWAPAR